jgi:hypothetical protein
MINIQKVIVIILLLTLSFSLRKKDIGTNDWVYENIGKI